MAATTVTAPAITIDPEFESKELTRTTGFKTTRSQGEIKRLTDEELTIVSQALRVS